MKDSHHSSGMTLIEVLVVISILLMLALMAIPAVSGVQNAINLTKAATQIREHLLLARQLAISRNEPILFDLCEMEDEAGTRVFNTLALLRFEKGGRPALIDRPVRLPVGYGVSDKLVWSSLMGLPVDKVTLRAGAEVDSRRIRFDPSGSTALSASETWFLTVYQTRRAGDPADNFITLAVDPVTGRVFSFQP